MQEEIYYTRLRNVHLTQILYLRLQTKGIILWI